MQLPHGLILPVYRRFWPIKGGRDIPGSWSADGPWPDHVPVPTFGPLMVCTACGGGCTSAPKQSTLKNLSEQQRIDRVEFVVGNTLVLLLHEMGQVHISEMHLPVLGREEDAADTFAALRLLQIGTDFSRRSLADAAKGWFLNDRRDQQAMIDAINAVVPMAALAAFEIRSIDASASRQNRTIQAECGQGSKQTR
jgi:putative metallopeptidase DUF4344